ncbi:MAG: hypothetical protein U0795_01980 [Pirellulales bacterium]
MQNENYRNENHSVENSLRIPPDALARLGMLAQASQQESNAKDKDGGSQGT